MSPIFLIHLELFIKALEPTARIFLPPTPSILHIKLSVLPLTKTFDSCVGTATGGDGAGGVCDTCGSKEFVVIKRGDDKDGVFKRT